jgi:hypothetical protein
MTVVINCVFQVYGVTGKLEPESEATREFVEYVGGVKQQSTYGAGWTRKEERLSQNENESIQVILLGGNRIEAV